MNSLYLFIHNDNLTQITKYGMKLSENANKVLNLKNGTKKGITAYLTPKDSDLYEDDEYVCLNINPENLNIYVYNGICEETGIIDDFCTSFEQYVIGDFEEPVAIICSSILPENISIYNKIKDLPLLVQNSKEYYYEKAINHILDTEKISKFELYQMLLILGEQKKYFTSTNIDNKLKVYTDNISKKKYTKKSSF